MPTCSISKYEGACCPGVIPEAAAAPQLPPRAAAGLRMSLARGLYAPTLQHRMGWQWKGRSLFVGMLLVTAFFTQGEKEVVAGPAFYDNKTKSFHLAYTFTVLPNGSASGAHVGAVVKPSQDEEDILRDLVGRVSVAVSQVTNGRAKISRLYYVDQVKNADLVISVSGIPPSLGWSTPNGIDGRPGYVGMYLQFIQTHPKREAVLAATHALCHYFFGLADEYDRTVFPFGCPIGSGPACLMDNFSEDARGFMGRLCFPSEHKPISGQPPSCIETVDRFFRERGVQTEEVSHVATDKTDPRCVLVASAIGKLRADSREQQGSGKPTVPSEAAAESILHKLVDEANADGTNEVVFSQTALSQVAVQVARNSGREPGEEPEYLDAEVFKQVKDEARRLAPSPSGEKHESERRRRIERKLTSFIGQLPEVQDIRRRKEDIRRRKEVLDIRRRKERKGLTKDQLKELDNQIKELENQLKELENQLKELKILITVFSRQESAGASQKAMDRLTGINSMSAQLDLANAEKIVAELGENRLDEKVVGKRRIVANIDTRLKTFGIPGRTAQVFGLPRSRFITPDPIDEHLTNVPTQGGVFAYSDVRISRFFRLRSAVQSRTDRTGETRVQPRRRAHRCADRSSLGSQIGIRVRDPPPSQQLRISGVAH